MTHCNSYIEKSSRSKKSLEIVYKQNKDWIMLNKSERIGLNIKALRKAHHETLEQLGDELGVKKNTIYYYEKGMHEPGTELLEKIAKYYMVSVEELVFCDFSDISEVMVDNTKFFKNINIILPIISTPEAEKNVHFRRALRNHKELYQELGMQHTEISYYFNICLDEYMEAYTDEKIKMETSANLLALYYLFFMSIESITFVKRNQPAVVKKLISKDSKVRCLVEEVISEYDVDEFEKDFSTSEKQELLNELRLNLKQSREGNDLSDYYLALQYFWNIIDNDLDWGFNKRLGAEMMFAFESVNNRYAWRYNRFILQ